MSAEEYGLTSLTAIQDFILNWRICTESSYMGGDPEEGSTELTRKVMDGDGGLLLALTMLEAILFSGDQMTMDGAAGDIAIVIEKFADHLPARVHDGAYVIAEEP